MQDSTGADDQDLGRFKDAQQGIYAQALSELRAGQKKSHWMWFIFPQVAGLGYSSASRLYGIRGLAEARAYLADPILGPRLLECTGAVMALRDRSAREIFGAVDELKFRSSMTLFAVVAGAGSLFQEALVVYFGGERDGRTVGVLEGG